MPFLGVLFKSCRIMDTISRHFTELLVSFSEILLKYGPVPR